MSVLKCKICGGDVECNSNMTLGTCQYCGSTITLPQITEEKRAEAFNRGNYYRRIGEFDSALAVYEHIISEDPNDAEAHWCAAISRFGIEYVEDPASLEYLPTCHRVSYESFLDDIDYLKALELSDGATQRQYKKDAAKIHEVQNGILAKSQVEEPFDIFICYKESDEAGRRTRDSVVAQEIFNRLTEAEYKTFFARITLEDKVGTEYEPYIFSALNSAKVMIVVGTSFNNLNSVWVKNEWSRFIALMKKDSSKVLLPCYLDMNPYDMPTELASLQAYDIAAMGFMQDLLRGISKIISPDHPGTRYSSGSQGNSAENFIKRGMLAIEAKEWRQADSYFEQALNADPESSRAYWGKVLAEKKASNTSELLKSSSSLKSSENYARAVRFADPGFQAELRDYEKTIKKRLATERRRRSHRNKVVFLLGGSLVVLVFLIVMGVKLYIEHVKVPSDQYIAATQLEENEEYDAAILAFEKLGEYKDSLQRVDDCKSKKAQKEINIRKANQKELYKKVLENADEGNLDEALSMLSDLDTENRNNAVLYIIDKFENSIKELGSIDNIMLQKVHSQIIKMESVAEASDLEVIKDIFNQKCIALMPKEIYQMSLSNYNFNEVSCQVYLEMLFDDGKYSKTISDINKIIDVSGGYARSIFDKNHNYIQVFIRTDDDGFYRISIGDGFHDYAILDAFIFSVSDVSFVSGNEKDKGTLTVKKIGEVEKKSQPFEGEPLRFVTGQE